MFREKKDQALQPQRQSSDQGKTMQRGFGSGYERGGVLSPFGLMRRMMEDMDRMFWDFGSPGTEPSGFAGKMSSWVPQVEVMQREGNLVVRADLPGMKEDDVHVNLEDDCLVIHGERKSEQEREEGGVFHSERSYGSFERRIALPRGVDPNTCDASFRDGVLEICLKMPEQGGARRIQIRGGTQTDQQVQTGKPQTTPATQTGQSAQTTGQATQTPQTKPPRGGEERENGTRAPTPRH